ncbi:MAG: hypothetical protein RL065_2129 [Bacteroidota bacterium]
MHHYFLDTNIIIDFLAAREPHVDAIDKLMIFANQNKVKLYASSLAFKDVMYIMRKLKSQEKLADDLLQLSKVIELMNVDAAIILESLQSGMKDFEDAVQYHTAISNKKIEAIVTRNHKDYKRSKIAVLTAEQAAKNI